MKLTAIPTDHGGCGYYRIVLPVSVLDQTANEIYFTQNMLSSKIYNADEIFINRVTSPNNITVVERIKSLNKRVVMDFDDNLHTLPSCNPCAKVYGNGKPATKIFEKALSLADVVTCSSHELAGEYRRFRQDIVVIENKISEEHLKMFAPEDISGRPKRAGQLRIGFAGSTSHVMDVASMRKVFNKIIEKYPHVRFVFCGLLPPAGFVNPKNVDVMGGIVPNANEKAADFMQRYYELIQSLDLDIAIAPLESNVFNRCKSAIKIIEYGIHGIPVVASRVGPYSKYAPRDGSGRQDLSILYTANDGREWIRNLSILIEEPYIRKKMAESNLEFIRAKHTIRATKAEWERILTP